MSVGLQSAGPHTCQSSSSEFPGEKEQELYFLPRHPTSSLPEGGLGLKRKHEL